MPLELNVHQYSPTKLGVRKLVKTLPYRRFCEMGEAPIFVQNGRAMWEDGTELTEFPAWFKMILDRDGEAGFKKVGGLPKPAKGK